MLIDRSLSTWATRDALFAGVLGATLAATSHLVTFVVAIAAAMLIALRIPTDRPTDRRRAVACAADFVLPFLWLVPLYVVLAQAFVGVAKDYRFFHELTWATAWNQIEFLYRDLPVVWRYLFALAVSAPIVFGTRRNNALWRVASTSLGAIVVALLVTRGGRLLYFLTPYAGLGLALWLTGFPAWLNRRAPSLATESVRSVVAAILIVTALVQVNTGLDFFRSQRAYYGILTPDLVAGIEAVRDSTDPIDVLAVPSLDNAPFGR
ncbi:MAG: hypothetical protein IH941_01180 [Acidobacteria bacterium]|nr:hypothetical protein [Acidobacteriota bacterium]